MYVQGPHAKDNIGVLIYFPAHETYFKSIGTAKKSVPETMIYTYPLGFKNTKIQLFRYVDMFICMQVVRNVAFVRCYPHIFC